MDEHDGTPVTDGVDLVIAMGRVCFAAMCPLHGVHVVVQGDDHKDYLVYANQISFGPGYEGKIVEVGQTAVVYPSPDVEGGHLVQLTVLPRMMKGYIREYRQDYGYSVYPYWFGDQEFTS